MIFWQYLKGFNETTTTSIQTDPKPLYTFIDFQYNNYDSSAGTTFGLIPELKGYSNSNRATEIFNAGHFITEKARGQSITQDFTFSQQVTVGGYANFKNVVYLYDATATGNIYAVHTVSALNVYLPDTSHYIDWKFNNESYYTWSASAATINVPVTIKGTTLIKDTSNNTKIILDASTGKCEATYFNTTSDIRAKTKIKEFNINALDLIKKVQVYSFTYKDRNFPSIGVIAQDLQDTKIGDFELVDNKAATGENMDYMSVHESKLVYVLWKAIQEQQKEIEELKEIIKEKNA